MSFQSNVHRKEAFLVHEIGTCTEKEHFLCMSEHKSGVEATCIHGITVKY